jgi:hypothetical protein
MTSPHSWYPRIQCPRYRSSTVFQNSQNVQFNIIGDKNLNFFFFVSGYDEFLLPRISPILFCGSLCISVQYTVWPVFSCIHVHVSVQYDLHLSDIDPV